MPGAMLNRAKLMDAVLAKADLKSAELTGAILTNAKLDRTQLRDPWRLCYRVQAVGAGK